MKSTRTIAAGVFALLAATSPAFAFEPIVVINGEGTSLFDGTTNILATAAQSDGEFGIAITTDTQPDQGPPLMAHTKEAELWFVLEGEFSFVADGQTYAGGPGTMMVVDAGTEHQFTSKGPGKLLMVWMPGGFEQFFVDATEGTDMGALEQSYGITRP